MHSIRTALSKASISTNQYAAPPAMKSIPPSTSHPQHSRVPPVASNPPVKSAPSTVYGSAPNLVPKSLPPSNTVTQQKQSSAPPQFGTSHAPAPIATTYKPPSNLPNAKQY